MCDPWSTRQAHVDMHSPASIESKLDGMWLGIETMIRASQKQWFEDVVVNIEKLRGDVKLQIKDIHKNLDGKASIDEVRELKAALTGGGGQPQEAAVGGNDGFENLKSLVKKELQLAEFQTKAALDSKAASADVEELKRALADVRSRSAGGETGIAGGAGLSSSGSADGTGLARVAGPNGFEDVKEALRLKADLTHIEDLRGEVDEKTKEVEKLTREVEQKTCVVEMDLKKVMVCIKHMERIMAELEEVKEKVNINGDTILKHFNELKMDMEKRAQTVDRELAKLQKAGGPAREPGAGGGRQWS